MQKLNPFSKKKAEILAKLEKDRQSKRAAVVKAKRSKAGKVSKVARNAGYKGLQDGLKASFKAAEDLIAEDERKGNYVPGDSSDEEED
tara:strand:+ start:500 stop:763 length:264 start_codon:yes stop_codon:yes gene_type:complete